jgi:hypothetical protein
MEFDMYKLLTAAAANTKTAKDDRYTNAILHLPPYTKSGKNYCAMAHMPNDAFASAWLNNGGNIAVIFDTKKGEGLPTSFWGRPVVDGDKSDLRFLDAANVVVGLRSKGKAKKAPTGNGGAYCWQICLDESGRGVFANVQAARQRRAAIFEDDRSEFKRLLWRDLAALCRKAERNGNQAACRLNGTSDLQWERIYPTLFTEFDEIRWYDYTKLPKRVVPANYHLTYSLQFIRSAASAQAAV